MTRSFNLFVASDYERQDEMQSEPEPREFLCEDHEWLSDTECPQCKHAEEDKG